MKKTPASSDPSGFWGLYSRLTFANARLTFSECPSLLPPCVTPVTMMSFIFTTRYSCCPFPALRWMIVPSLMWTPVAHACIRTGDALSTAWTNDRSWNVALPSPPPDPWPIEPALLTPQEYDSTSISSLCLASSDSPLMSPSFAKMSEAMIHAPFCEQRTPGSK